MRGCGDWNDCVNEDADGDLRFESNAKVSSAEAHTRGPNRRNESFVSGCGIRTGIH